MEEKTNTENLQQPPPDPELKRLEPLIGAWSATDHTLDSILGPGVPVVNWEAFSWLEGGYFLVQTYNTTFGDEPAQKGINYWFYDTEVKRFRIIFFSNNGPYTEEGNRYEGEIADGKLTFTGPARFQYELDANGKIKVNPDGTITVAWWLRDHDGNWKPWMTNTFSRAGKDKG
jgi:hypothetical protein